ncbi:hypothetical protein [Rhodopirellula sp. MGV]|uniref:hypothetical protein n=1 Tax=Rhodopirellula sp. MGV TaxID=2023130 RepID=UPI000B97A96F|nr:hypothetical protein [Rhodopirellula sp. MGV]OYP29372.1 hypothetical protein CGZ80_24490 [Rhodopirellula sp. MGV]PNY35678.1 hypothetical protein C2E31_16445 [Rhodopirellula baltica]
MNAPDVAYQVARQFAVLRRRYLTVRIATLLGLGAATFCLWIALLVWADFKWELAGETRSRGLLGGAVVVFFAMSWRLFVIVKETRKRTFAGILERSYDDFGQRIRTVLDTVDGRISGPVEMLRALGNQTLGRWDLAMPNRIVPFKWMYLGGICFLIAAAVLASLHGAGGEARLALHRVLGSQQPYTELEVSPGDKKVLEGTPLSLSLDLVGRTDREVLIRYREVPLDLDPQTTDENIEWIESKLAADKVQDESYPSEGRKRFSLNLGNAIKPVEYQFVSAGRTTKMHRIDIQPLIELKRLAIDVTPPEYTGLQPRLFDRSEITVLERSEVQVTVEVNHPLASTELLIGPKKSQMQPVELVPGDDPRVWTFSLPTEDTVRWTFAGAGPDGTPMDPVEGRLGIRRDRAPELRWTEPSDELRVHTLAEVPLTVQVSDDYGVVESGIAFQIGSDVEYVLVDWVPDSEGDHSGSMKTRLKLSEILPLESFRLTERDYIAYYAYAVDNRPWGAHRTESDVRYIDIRPLRQFFREAEIEPMPGGNGRVIVQLDELIRRERFVINRTRNLIRKGDDLASELGAIDRLVKNQSELADLTRFLAEFFLERGNDDVEALSRAEASMLQAADSLAAGAMELAFAQEEDALQSLVEARRELEILLTNMQSPSQRRAMNQLARQLQQKLRRDRPQTPQELVDTLKRIASDQRQLARQSRQMQNGSQGSGGTSGGKPTDMPATEGSNSDQPATEPQENAEAEMPTDQNAEGQSAEDQSDNAGQGGEETEETADPAGANDSTADDSDAPSEEEMLYEAQVELLARLEAVRDELDQELESSELLSGRMQKALEEMDTLADQARERNLPAFSRQGNASSDLLEEMSNQLESIAATEPVTRISTLRDLTVGMGMMERQLSDRLRGGQGGQGEDEAGNDETQLERTLNRIAARGETLKEVLSSQAEIGDIEMSEVNDRLRQFADEAEFMGLLADSRQAIGEVNLEDQTQQNLAGEAAMDRANDYVDAARQLERLYQQLVTPRLARLRQMEQQATQLSQQSQNGSGEPSEQPPEIKAQMQQLAQDLRDESLRELAELLEDGSGGVGDEPMENESQGGSSEADDQRNGMPANADGSIQSLLIGSNGGGGISLQNRTSGRLQVIAQELRRRIQQVILLEIAADRDTPVPSEYQRAVDGYFRTLSSDDASTATSGAAQ